MKGKILLVVGLGVGYVLGARAGREQYNKMKSAASAFWNDPRVKARVDDVEDFVKEKAPEVSGFLADSAKKVAQKMTGSGTASTAKSPRKSATKSTETTSAAAKAAPAKAVPAKSAATKTAASKTASSK
jgi:hypothetical protein